MAVINIKIVQFIDSLVVGNYYLDIELGLLANLCSPRKEWLTLSGHLLKYLK